MAGERKKPTAAEKGKAIAVQEKKKDKGLEAALNATRAAQLRRPGGVVINEPATATDLRRSVRNRTAPAGMDTRGTPGSRKRARDDDVVPGPRAAPHRVPPTAPSPPPIVDGDDYRELFSKASRSVVTVAFDMSVGQEMETRYRTGFILIEEENYCLILTTSRPLADGIVKNYFIYFVGEKSQTIAHEFRIIDENHLLILIVQTNKRHEAVNLSCDSLGYEVIFTVCTSGGTRLNDKVNAPLIKELEGSLGIYKGAVGTPCCDALDASYRHIVGSENYFQFSLSLHDDIITLKNIDAEKHTTEIAVAAPVFRLNGKTAGMLFSEGGWTDSKIGLHAKSIIFCLRTSSGSDEWEEALKKTAKLMLETWSKNN